MRATAYPYNTNKMVIVQTKGRTQTAVSWASGDSYALQVATKIASEQDGEFYWRAATPAEFQALEQQRIATPSKRLPGW